MATTPEGFEDLLERPVYGVLATVRAEGGPSATPMWFLWDGEFLRFTHTTKRRKLKDLEAEPRLAFTIIDPENPYRYLEVRGEVDHMEEDPTGSFYVVLGKRYGNAEQTPPPDSADRVIIVVRPTYFGRH